MDSEKHPDFLNFLVGVGWGMEGVEIDGDSPEGKIALSTPTASLASRFKAPRVYLGMHCCKCMVWPQSQPALAGKDGKEQELQELLRI